MARPAAVPADASKGQRGPAVAMIGPPPDQLVPLELSLLPPSLCTAFGVMNSPPAGVRMAPFPQHSPQQASHNVSHSLVTALPALPFRVTADFHAAELCSLSARAVCNTGIASHTQRGQQCV